MGVNATARAEVMLCSVGIELVHGEQFAALRNADAVQIRRHRNRPAHATVRTRTTPRRAKPIGQSCCKPHSTAMAGAVDRIYGGLHARLLFGIRTNNYTLSTPPARPMRASALLAANDRFRETRTPARLVSGRAALVPCTQTAGLSGATLVTSVGSRAITCR